VLKCQLGIKEQGTLLQEAGELHVVLWLLFKRKVISGLHFSFWKSTCCVALREYLL